MHCLGTIFPYWVGGNEGSFAPSVTPQGSHEAWIWQWYINILACFLLNCTFWHCSWPSALNADVTLILHVHTLSAVAFCFTSSLCDVSFVVCSSNLSWIYFCFSSNFLLCFVFFSHSSFLCHLEISFFLDVNLSFVTIVNTSLCRTIRWDFLKAHSLHHVLLWVKTKTACLHGDLYKNCINTSERRLFFVSCS